MKKTLITLIISLLSLVSFAQSMDDRIKALANEIADQIVANGGTKVAVTTLDYKNCNTEFGKYLAEELTGYLSTSGKKVTVVNQKMLEALLIQNKLTAKGLLEAKNDAAKLGSVSGINSLVYGTITSFGDDLRLSLSVVKLPTLEVFGFAKSSLASSNSIKNMLPCLTENNIVDERVPDDDEPKPVPDKDKNCEKNQRGSYYFVNTTNKDVRILYGDPQMGSLNFIIRAQNKHLATGLWASGGSYSGKCTLYRDITKEEKPEFYPLFVEVCKTSTLIIK